MFVVLYVCVCVSICVKSEKEKKREEIEFVDMDDMELIDGELVIINKINKNENMMADLKNENENNYKNKNNNNNNINDENIIVSQKENKSMHKILTKLNNKFIFYLFLFYFYFCFIFLFSDCISSYLIDLRSNNIFAQNNI